MAQSYDDVLQPLTDVTTKLWLSPNTWKVNFGRGFSTKFIDVASSTSLSDEGFKQTLTIPKYSIWSRGQQQSLSVGIEIAAETTTPAWILNPAVFHSAPGHESKLVVPLQPDSDSLLGSPQLTYSFTHPSLRVDVDATLEGKFIGLPATIKAASFIHPGWYAGVSSEYDALRSGLKSYSVVFRHQLPAARRVPLLQNVFAFAQYGNRDGVAVSVVGNLEANQSVSIATTVSKQVALVAAQFTCPRTASTVGARVDLREQLVGITTSLLTRAGTIGLTLEVPNFVSIRSACLGFSYSNE